MQNVSRLINSFIPEQYNLSLAINRTSRQFQGVVDIKGESLIDGQLSLHAKELVIETALIDGRAADFTLGSNDELLITQDGLLPGEHLVTIGFSGAITDQMHGMYPCYFEHNGEKKELIATQFESHHAREVFPCVDEPEAKATFDLTLTTEKDITVLGNMPVKLQHEENDVLVTSFETTPRMSSYLLAWVAGEMHKKTATTKDGVEVNVWATPAQRPESLDFALKEAVSSIEFFNDYFDVAYPLPKSDHVALPDFSSGAMENWGLITYRETTLLADPETTTVASKQYISTVINHELSHQWFGNLVTMQWWNNLWLNESFATLMEYIAVDAIHPDWNIWLDFATNESIMALRRDAIDGVQSVQVEVHHPDEISSLFDGAIVYAKGARLMRMCQNFIGRDAFRTGLSSYFKEFSYKNTEADDLWRHLSAASGKDIAGLMNTWISQSGYPVVHVGENELTQEQFFTGPHQPSDKLWPIPLDSTNPETPQLLEAQTLSITLQPNERLNKNDATHMLTHYNDEHLAALLGTIASENELGRLQLMHEQTLLARGHYISSSQLIPLLESYKDETAQSVWDIMAVTFGELKKFVETDEAAEQKLRNFSAQLANTEYTRLGWEQKAGEPEADTKQRSLILGMMTYSEETSILDTIDSLFVGGIETIHPEIRSLVISSVVKRNTDIKLIETLLSTYKHSSSADLRDDLASGLTSVKQPEQIRYLLDAFTDSSVIRKQDLFRWFAYLMRNRYARELTWEWMVAHWQWIIDNFAGDKSYDDFARYSAAGLVTREQLAAYRAFFEPKMDIPALKRTIELGITEIEGRIELLERDSDDVRQVLLAL